VGGSGDPRHARAVDLDSGTVSFKDAALNLTNCVMGAGALSLPSFFRSCGVVTGSAILVASGVWTWVSVLMMLATADALSSRSLHGIPVASYEDLMDMTLGVRGRTLSTVAIVLLQLGCLVGYANILADVMSPFAIDILPPGLEPNRGAVLTAVTLGGMLPVGLVVGGENPSLLAMVSMISLGIVATFCVVLVAHAFSPENEPGYAGKLPGPVVYSNPAGVMSALPLVIFAFGAHPAVLPVLRTMRPSSLKANTSLVSVVLVACGLAYFLIGLGGYLSFRSATAGNVLRNLDGVFLGSSTSKTLKFGYGLVVLGSVPTILLPLQKSAKDAYLFLVPSAAVHLHAAATNASRWQPPQQKAGHQNVLERSEVEVEKAEAQAMANDAAAGIGIFAVKSGGVGSVGMFMSPAANAVIEVSPELSARLSQAVALSSMLAALCLALYVPNVEFAFGLTGSTCSFLITFVLPAMAYLSATSSRARVTRAASKGSSMSFNSEDFEDNVKWELVGGSSDGGDGDGAGDGAGGRGNGGVRGGVHGDDAEDAGGGSGTAASGVSLSECTFGNRANSGWESAKSVDTDALVDEDVGGSGGRGFSLDRRVNDDLSLDDGGQLSATQPIRGYNSDSENGAARAERLQRRQQVRQWWRHTARVQVKPCSLNLEPYTINPKL